MSSSTVEILEKLIEYYDELGFDKNFEMRLKHLNEKEICNLYEELFDEQS